MRTILFVLVLFLAGCMTTYEIRKQSPEGDVVVIVKSFREFQQPKIHYDRNGDSVTFDFNAESATTGVSPVEQALADSIRAGAMVLSPIAGEGEN